MILQQLCFAYTSLTLFQSNVAYFPNIQIDSNFKTKQVINSFLWRTFDLP